MGKYEPLSTYLTRQTAAEVALTFAQIESLIGASLPPVAHKHRAWWSNNASNNVMTKAWLDAGFQTEKVDMNAETLVFRRRTDGPPMKEEEPTLRSLGLLDRLRAKLGGTVTIAPGVDLTDPTWELPDDLK
jgi:hypothetical protein